MAHSQALSFWELNDGFIQDLVDFGVHHDVESWWAFEIEALYAHVGRHAGGERIQVSTECVQYVAKIVSPKDESTELGPWNSRDPTRLDVKTLHRGDGQEENVNQDINRAANARMKGVLSGGGRRTNGTPGGCRGVW